MDALNIREHSATDEEVFLALGGDLIVNNAEQMQATLNPHLSAEKNLVLDLADIADIDTAGLQLLLSLEQLQSQHGKAFNVCGLTAAQADDFGALGVARLIVER